MLNRRRFLMSAAGLAALATLPACGDTATAEGTATAASGAEFPRTVRHEEGETRLEEVPQRVVCGTDGGELCSLLALGVRPVGFGKRNDPLKSWLTEPAKGLESYDLSGGETNYERLAAWRPDLLLVQKGFATPETMPRFSEIAPTVATSFIDWRENLRQVAEAVGRQERARELLAEKDAAVRAAAGRLDARTKGLRVRGVTAFADGSVYVLNDASPLGKIATTLGLAPLPKARAEGEAVDQISLEQLDIVDGDLLLLFNFGAENDGGPDLQQKGVWKQLDVVRAGKVVPVAGDDADQLYFDSVLTVEPNARLVERIVTGALS